MPSVWMVLGIILLKIDQLTFVLSLSDNSLSNILLLKEQIAYG